MKALRFRLHTMPPQRVDMRALNPQNLMPLSLREIEYFPLQMGRETVALADVFEVHAGARDVIELQDSCDSLDHLGEGWRDGKLYISGNVGAYLGKQMTGGQLFVDGNVGDYAAMQIQGGELLIRGNTGAYLATQAGTRGTAKVIVTGNAGARVAMAMRRGLVLVEGNIGEYGAACLRAGTLCCFGTAAKGLGYGMQRGSIGVSRLPENLSLNFRASGRYTGIFLNLLQQACYYPDSPARQFIQAQRYIGDCAMLGKGELLLLHA